MFDAELDVNGNKLAFDGNNYLRPANVQISYTKELIEEWVKCRDSIQYFAENYVYIISLDKGKIKPKIRDYQQRMIDTFDKERFIITLASRQVGKTVSSMIFILHFILFNQDKNIAILANKAATSSKILRDIKAVYELLPKWLQQGVKVWNAGSIRLENGCSIFASSTSSNSIRGESINILFIDECIDSNSVLTVRDKETGNIKQITIEELSEILD